MTTLRPDSIDAPLADFDLGDDASAERPRLVIEVWMVRLTPSPEALLLHRRPEQGGFWQGVSGRVERFDATLREAARREVLEETGFDIAPERFFDLGGWHVFQGVVSKRWFVKRPLGLLLPDRALASVVVLSHEHDAAEDVALDDAVARLMFEDNRALLGEAAHIAGAAASRAHD